jgi:hypothetical protein
MQKMQLKSKLCIKIPGNDARILGITIKQEYYLHDTFMIHSMTTFDFYNLNQTE